MTAAAWYVKLPRSGHPRADKRGRVNRSVLVMEQHIGRFIHPDEEVHHINEIKTDDRIENLELLTRREHQSKHNNLYSYIHSPRDPAKYDSLRKTERNRTIREYRLTHTELSYRNLGHIFNLDATRIWRICTGNQIQRYRPGVRQQNYQRSRSLTVDQRKEFAKEVDDRLKMS